MSIFTSSLTEGLGFIYDNISALLQSLLLMLTLIFFPSIKRKSLAYSVLVIGILYLIKPLVTIDETFRSRLYNTYLLTAKAQGYSPYYGLLEYVIDRKLHAYYRPLKTITTTVDTVNILSRDLNTDSKWSDVTQTFNTENDILILGIGESLRARNMGIYGYERSTTPNLSSIKGHLGIFEGAYAAGANTWSSLPATLSITHKGQADISLSIINLINDADYKSYWISNHARFSQWDFSVSSIADQAHNTIFLSNNNAGKFYDSALLDHVEMALEQHKPGDKTFIVIHFYGSHSRFKDRYPDEFSFYKQDDKIDHYDNSIRFTDHLQGRVIKLVNKYKAKYLFFADHGLTDKELTDHQQSWWLKRVSPQRGQSLSR